MSYIIKANIQYGFNLLINASRLHPLALHPLPVFHPNIDLHIPWPLFLLKQEPGQWWKAACKVNWQRARTRDHAPHDN